MTGHQELLLSLRKTFWSGHTLSLAWRREQLRALHRMVEENRQEWCAALREDLGKSVCESLICEIEVGLQDVALALRCLPEWAGRRRVVAAAGRWWLPPPRWMARLAHALAPWWGGSGASEAPAGIGGTSIASLIEDRYVQAQPLGVVLIMTAWNYPLALAMWHLTSALAAGNCVVLKPSEQAPATAQLLQRLMDKYLDRQAVRVVLGDAAVAKALLHVAGEPAPSSADVLSACRWDLVHFTGGWRIARQVSRACAETLTPCVLELGGKNPVVVDAGSLSPQALGRVARIIMWSKLINAGQTCLAADYALLVGADAAATARFSEQLAAAAVAMYGERPLDNADYPRIVSTSHVRRVAQLLKETGGTVVHGGECLEAQRYVQPTIVSNVSADDALMQEEIFGPVLPLLSGCADVEAAMQLLQQRAHPLVLYAFSSAPHFVQRLETHIASGALVVNDIMSQATSPGLPFGGVGLSGHGNSRGQAGFDAFSHLRSVLKKSLWSERLASDRYAPFTESGAQHVTSLVHVPPP
ncbi:hypothetical protein CDCA_CDCA08G2562 [Cyanidium caldarium]|uniref:Aldehyde dehydrogenase n=1 Tax=Cyanidium caldarium TaxID=2771 RepID=A0AAV9IW25_CYACA|nr:hypothetical protein CDCA_CDCA08G2562 [Cyanidium caldarium]